MELRVSEELLHCEQPKHCRLHELHSPQGE
jgi:hypothetical protein